jgi:hypothetical protein
VPIGKQDFAERCVFVNGDWFRRTWFGSEQSAIGSVDVATAESNQPASHSDETGDRGTGVVLTNREHVEDDVGRGVAQAGWKVENRY